ncbi:MAG: FAD-dependent oxidoreductase [Candidatus Omnitrophota bacterium]
MTSNGKKIVVIGGGVAGMTAALEAAETGYDVVLVEKEAYLGGRAARMHRYFPKMCPPTCGMEINFKRLRSNPRVTIYTLAKVIRVTGQAGDYEVTIQKKPRRVKDNAVISAEILEKLTSERDNDFNMGMNKTKALYYPHPMAFPAQYVLDAEALSKEDRTYLETECANAVDFNAEPEEIAVKAGAIVIATGWRPYDARKIENLGFGRCANVITNVMMERLASPEGPTGGKLVRPSDGKEIKRVAFAQCAGSRDEKHLPYCSAVCCMGSLKQARYVLEQSPEASVTIFYIDIRTISRHEKFYYELMEDKRVTFVKGKAAQVTENPATGDPIVELEDAVAGKKKKETFDLVVLAAGMEPNTAAEKIPCEGIVYDEYGFVVREEGAKGIFAAGCAQRPVDVARAARQATGAALKAIQCM